MSFLQRLIIILFVWVAPTGIAAPWADVESDLPTDPLLKSGTLPNGLRYVILPNREPRDRISLRLLVSVGSLHENDDELGLAHFVEHMAFRGTRAYPAGSLTAALQRLGVGFGPDSTAFTGFEHTIYHLELPDTKTATLREGLRALREYADGVTFDKKAIERERGVMLSEHSTRDTPQSRASDRNLETLWPDSRVVRRKIGGDPALLQRFTRDQFVAFYDAWYRPERMALIVVGDIETTSIEPLVGECFASLAGRGPPRPEPADLITSAQVAPNVVVHSDPGQVGFSFLYQHPRYHPRRTDSHADRVRALHEGMAFMMLQLRLTRLAQKADASFVTPSVVLGPGIRDWQIATIGAAGRINDWQRVATDIEFEHRRAFQYGFTPHELEEVRTHLAMKFQQGTRSAVSRDSSTLAHQIAESLLHGGVVTTPAEIERDLAPALAATTRQDCLDAFRAVWTKSAPNIFITTHPSFDITRERIAAAMNESRQRPVLAPDEIAKIEFAYTDFGPPGKVTAGEHLADLDVRLSRFENGVRFNFKPTPFMADIVEFRVRVGSGKLAQLQSQPGIDILSNLAFTASGLGRHSASEMLDVFASRALQIGFNVESDACVFAGRCARRDLLFALQVVSAYLTDPAFRPEVMREAHAHYSSMFAGLAASPGGPITAYAPRLIFNDDSRFGVPEFEQLLARNLGEVEAWLTPQLRQGPVELCIVGDTTWEEASQIVASTLGALPTRSDPPPRREEKLTFSSWENNSLHRVFTSGSTLKQVAIAWYWPAPIDDIRAERRCNLLAQIVADRLRLRLREELGATYSPQMQYVDLEGFPGSGHFLFYAEIQPDRAEQALKILNREMRELAKKGPNQDEFERAKAPYLREMSDNLRTNIYWAATVLDDAQQRPERIVAARSRAKDIQAITRRETADLARKYLAPDQAYKFVTVPAPKEAAAPNP